MPKTKKMTATAAPGDGGQIYYGDYRRMLKKNPRCTDAADVAYKRYRRTLQRAIEHGTRSVAADAKKRLKSLDRAINGYESMTSVTLKNTAERRASTGPHIHGQQCKPVFVARFPPTDSKALRIDDGKKKHKKH